MIDELEIERWLNQNCRVQYVEGCSLLIGRNYYQLGTLKVNGLETIQKCFPKGSKVFIFRDWEGRILHSLGTSVTMECCKVEINNRYSLNERFSLNGRRIEKRLSGKCSK